MNGTAWARWSQDRVWRLRWKNTATAYRRLAKELLREREQTHRLVREARRTDVTVKGGVS